MSEKAGYMAHVAPPRLSTDNAVMIAAVASERLAAGQTGSWIDDADPNLRFSF
jgi:tRNA A37 threonylcarbamoyltransferase TsaD